MQTISGIVQSFPVLTTILGGMFAADIIQRYLEDKSRLHFLWWGIGLVFYSVGTLMQSLIGFAGWHEFLYKSWYISWTLLAAAPLAVGTIYFVASKAAGHTGVILVLLTSVVTTCFIVLSPINRAFANAEAFNSLPLAWDFISYLPMALNVLAGAVFIGGAISSAQTLMKDPTLKNRSLGSILIAVGGLLPGFATAVIRGGHLNFLYTIQLLGLMFMWYGYYYCIRPELDEPSSTRRATKPARRSKQATV